MSPPQLDPAEEQARARYMTLNAVRIASLACVIAGIAGAREVLAIPYALSVILAVGGLVAFYFAPKYLVRRWKAGDDEA